MKNLEMSSTLNLKRLVLAVAMTACMVSPAWAATPKSESVITHDQIVLGDVFDGVEDNANYFLAPAPAPGKTVTLNAHDLTRISEAFHLNWVPENDLVHVVVRRASSAIDRFDVQDAVQKKLSQVMKGQKFEAELTERSFNLNIPEKMDKTLMVDDLNYDVAKGTFRATVTISRVKKEVTGKFYQVSQLPVLRAPLNRGDVIAAADLDYIDMRANDISSNMVVNATRLIGQTPRRSISALKPIMLGDVQLPLIVKKGDLVTMKLTSRIISLTTQGKALDSGAEGDAIRVMNTSSKQVVDAVVIGPQTVNVKAPTDALALNTL